MLDNSKGPLHDLNADARLLTLSLTFTHPEDVLASHSLDDSEKRAILAAWASDVHAVPNMPAMRQLESGAIVSIDAVLAALRALDASTTVGECGKGAKLRPDLVSRWSLGPRDRGNDDDDPPPCPAGALPSGVDLELRRRRNEAWGLAAG